MGTIVVTIDAGYRLHKACFGFLSASETEERAMQKAIGHKYIRKVPKKSGKGFYYIYAEAFKKPLQVLKTMFGIDEERITNDFVEHHIEKEYGADKKTFAAHILEYVTNKAKWDGIFSRRENRATYKQAVNTKKTSQEKQSGGAEKKAETEKNTTMKVNRSLMYKVWTLYGKKADSGSGGGGDDGEPPDDDISNLENILKNNTIPFPKGSGTKAHYNELFENGVDTPIGKVKMGEHQYEKFSERNRTNLIEAAYSTLTAPTLIINDNGSKLFIKTFELDNNGLKNIVSVVITKDGNNISVSTHEKRLEQLLKKAKKSRDVIYITDTGNHGTVRHKGAADDQTIPQSGEKSSASLSNAMLGNDNAKKDFSEQEKERAKKNEKRQKEGLPQIGLFERESALEDATWDYTSENYRYKDTGYIAGSRKELAQNYIKQAAKEKRQVLERDIDWEGLEENPRLAKQLITKSNVFGSVDWETLKQNGMTGGTAFLLDRVYAAVAAEADDTPESRRNYVIAINGLRSRLEESKTVQELVSKLSELNGETKGSYIPLEHQAEYIELKNQLEILDRERKKELEPRYEYIKSIVAKYPNSTQKLHKLLSTFDKTFNTDLIQGKYREREAILQKKLETIIQHGITANPLRSALMALGDRFTAVLNYRGRNGSTAFASHVIHARRGKYDNWEWANKETTVTRGATKQRINFELKVASRFNRKGGRPVSVKSTEELKKMFKLRDIQSGNWVLKDPDSAKFHVDHACEGFADLSDITGIPDSLISLNGRLALAIGARGSGGFTGGASAHYEPIERVINITKMKGGGSLAHEWFHAFDNLISEAMQGGNINTYLTNPDKKNDTKNNAAVADERSRDEYVVSVKSSFDNLVKTMTEGNVPIKAIVMYSGRDYNVAKYNFDNAHGGLAAKIKDAGTLENAITLINKSFEGKIDKKNATSKSDWVRITCAYYGGNVDGGIALVDTGKTKSKFYVDAMNLDGDSKKSYWSSSREMAARAFSAYIDDELRKKDRLNDYLAFATTNELYKDPFLGDICPYPEGDERKKINVAFAQLFDVIKRTGAIRKSLNVLSYDAWLQFADKLKEFRRRKRVEELVKALGKTKDQPRDKGGRFGFKNKTVDKKQDLAHTHDGGSDGERAGTGEIQEGFRDDRVRGEGAIPESSQAELLRNDGTHGNVQASSGTTGERNPVEVQRGARDGSGRSNNNSLLDNTSENSALRSGLVSLKEYGTALGRRFHRAFSEAHRIMNNSAFVDVHDEDYYKNNQNLLHEDGKTGISVEPNGTITSAFNASKERKGTLDTTIIWAIEHGGDRLDCFDGELRRMYASYGFIPVARVPFNPDYAPEGWDYGPKHDNKPDVLVWRHNGEDTKTILEKKESKAYKRYSDDDIEKLPVFSDYDEALAHRDHLIELHRIKKRALQKSLTYAGYPLQGRMKVQGMDISIENKKGSVRFGVDRDGHEWAIKMAYDYGYIRGTVGKDNDHVDAYVGSNPESDSVYIIHQNDPATGKYDEDKVMLGFNSAREAKAAYMRQYDRPGFFGSMDVMSIDEFKDRVFNTSTKGKKIA